MGPAAFMTNADNPIFTIADWADDIGILYHLFGFYEFLPHYDFITWIGHIFCDIAGNEALAGLCENIVFIFTGINEAQLNMYVLYFASSKSILNRLSRSVLLHSM
jgi:hypothetical protein